jgi:hypothetical protein
MAQAAYHHQIHILLFGKVAVEAKQEAVPT